MRRRAYIACVLRRNIPVFVDLIDFILFLYRQNNATYDKKIYIFFWWLATGL